jgi:hypothetical protein
MEVYRNFVFNNYEDNNDRQAMINMLNAVHELNLMVWLRDFNHPNGLMFGGGQNYNNLMNHPLVNESGHSGASAAACARRCQYILQNVIVPYEQ